jgi:hypothetical protein
MSLMMASQPNSYPDGKAAGPSARSLGRTLRSVLRLIEVRLRIPLVLLIFTVVVGRWDVIRNYWDKLTREVSQESAAASPVSSDTEYFCPMDPGVVSDWPGKCGICNMGLVRRKRGEATTLPGGVVARMQISPYRIQLAGIRTEGLAFLPLVRSYRAAGMVCRESGSLFVALEVPARHASWIEDGKEVSIQCKDAPRLRPLLGRIRLYGQPTGQGSTDLKATIAVTDPASRLAPGMIVDVLCRTPVCRLEPFRSLPTDPPPLKAGDPRRLYSCPEHPGAKGLLPGRCPIDRRVLEATELLEHERIEWWCPMHPAVTADHPGERCKECGGMILRPRAVSFQPAGRVLAVPESAVIDTGLCTVVFVETMPGTFDGVEVALGPRCEGYYPVVSGVRAGQKVAVSGAFLLDAETRLNPSLASSYFGATGRSAPAAAAGTAAAAVSVGDRSPFAKLEPEDRALAERQKVCPVTRKALGSMGTPTRVVVSGRVVFLCCAGCEDAIRSDPARYLAELAATPRP